MADVLPQIILVLVLVVMNAVFAGTEMALVSLREGQLQRLEDRSANGALLADLARRPNQFLATIQVGITLAGFLASAFAAVSLAGPLEEPLSFLGGAARPVAIVVVTLLLSFLTLVFGELAPKRIAMQRAEQWGLLFARPMALLARATRPIVWLLSTSTDLAVRSLGGDPEIQREAVTDDELREMVATQSSLDGDQRLIIHGAFDIADRTLNEILVPRSDVFVIDAGWTCERALDALAASGHTRAPVAAGRSLDEVVGVVNLRQLVGSKHAPVAARMVEAPVLPESARVVTALRELQAKRLQMAVVVNERGATAGIVTIEDLVEELVGEIYDENDADPTGVHHEPDGSVVVPGRYPVRDLAALGVDAPAGRYATVAGLALDHLHRVPSVGDEFDLDGRTVEIRAMDGHAITEVAIGAARAA